MDGPVLKEKTSFKLLRLPLSSKLRGVSNSNSIAKTT